MIEPPKDRFFFSKIQILAPGQPRRSAPATSLGDTWATSVPARSGAERQRSCDGVATKQERRDHAPAQSEATRRSGAPEERISPKGPAATGRTATARAERAQAHRTKQEPAERWKNRSPQQPHRRKNNPKRGLEIKPWGAKRGLGEVCAQRRTISAREKRRGMPGGERRRPRGERGRKRPEPTAGTERGGGAREGAPSPLDSPTNS